MKFTIIALLATMVSADEQAQAPQQLSATEINSHYESENLDD